MEHLNGSSGETLKRGNILQRHAEKVLSIFLVLSLSAFSLSLYLPFVRTHLFVPLSIFALLVWRYVLKSKPVGTIPRDVILFSSLFFFTLLVSALRSSNQPFAFYMFDEYKYFFLGGLLFTAPLSTRYRKIIIIVLFVCAAMDGLAGILQFYGYINKGLDRPHGFAALSIIYTAKLAFIPATALLLLTIKKDSAPKTGLWFAFLVVTAVLTFGGILLSGGRGTWIAIAAACTITLFLYDRKKALIFALSLLAVFVGLFVFSGTLRSRAVTVVTSIQTPENARGLNGTHTRFELWKGSLLLLKEAPLMGVGVIHFKENIERLVREKRIQKPLVACHAHNDFFQVLATQGITGFVAFIGLLVSLIRWGLREVRDQGNVGGYIIILCTLLTFFSGLTDSVIGYSGYVPIFFLIVGLLGPCGRKERPLRIP